jgi:hypothetical protein
MAIFGRNKPLFDSTSTPHFTNSYRIQGKSIVCPHCGQDKFDQAVALLNTPGMTFFGLDWANRTSTILCCRQCGRIEWFLRQPEELK